eukprot:gene32831-biopygen7812
MELLVGDRVEVLMEQTLHTAEVRAVYSSGKGDVVYDADNTVGYLLSKAEHGLNKMWMPKKKRKGGGGGRMQRFARLVGAPTPLMQEDSAQTTPRSRARWKAAPPKQLREACAANTEHTASVFKLGVCAKHGAHGICTAWGCTTNAASGKKGHCIKHSKDKCSTPGCRNGVAARGLCRTHGARGFCTSAGCDSGAVKDGLCFKHGAHGFCTFNDCATAAHLRGLCGRHGGGKTKVCDIEGCKTLARARNRCARHGAFGWCKIDECTTPAAQGFKHCIAHGGGKKKKPCSVAGCTTGVQSKGLCYKHGGGREECRIAGCTNQIYGFLKTCRKHGGTGYCQHPSGCIAPATKYGANCRKHTKKEKK